jgi:hypothetical protein
VDDTNTNRPRVLECPACGEPVEERFAEPHHIDHARVPFGAHVLYVCGESGQPTTDEMVRTVP